MRIVADMSSIIWTCLCGGKDVEAKQVEFEGKQVSINTAEYGYYKVLNHFFTAMRSAGATPKDLVLVFEGMNSKAPRLSIDPKYKANRGNRPLEYYKEFADLAARLKSDLGSLGALSVTQDEVEGDDIVAYIAQNAEENIMVDSFDGDLAVLSGVNRYGATVYVYRDGKLDENPCGDFASEYITVYKALVGDTSDGIKGIIGFGDAAFKSFMEQFGEYGLSQLKRMAEEGSLEDLVPEDSNTIIKKIVAGRFEFLKSYQLAQLRPDWVNTLHNQLRWSPGLIKGSVDEPRYAQWAATAELITASDWDEFVEVFKIKLAESEYVALDIETSTSEESDEWLAAQSDEEGKGVDVIGSELTGMSLTFGSNQQHTVYIPVDHASTDNVDKDKLRDLIASITVPTVVHNYSFEGTVLFHEWGQHWKNNGNEGLLPNALDTKFEASYVNENESLGLKKLSKMYFDYDQVDYAAVTTIDGVPHKMRELTGEHVKAYGCDDTIVTSSLHNFFKFIMQLEHTWKVYLDVEIDAMYGHTQSFINGFRCDVAKCKELEALDDITFDTAWGTLQGFLISKGWEGSMCPVYGPLPEVVGIPVIGQVDLPIQLSITPAQIKEAFEIVTGKPLVTSVRKMDKLIEAVRGCGETLFADCLEALVTNGSADMLNKLVAQHFKAAPTFNPGSPLQMQKLLYETMGLPMRVFNKPTAQMKAKGIRRGTPKSDNLALAYAKQLDADSSQKAVLDALLLMKMVQTRRGLYYKPYPYFVHYATGRIHSSHNQCATNTRRASSSKPNMQQMPKHPKIEGQAARFREVMLPHKPNAVIVSMDFMAQELRVIADYSKDTNMVACYVGDNLRDMHLLTGLGIAQYKQPVIEWSYELMVQLLDDSKSPMHKFVKECRTLGKKTNFTVEYGAMAPKVAVTLMVTEEEAQAYIDAREAAFPQVKVWKEQVVQEAYELGYVTSKLGARRHLASALTSDDYLEVSKAERQAVNYKIQGSSAEMTKLAEGRMWKARLEQLFDCKIIGPVHDELVASCAIEDLYEFLAEMHACMVEPYADMVIPIGSSISFGPSFGVQFEVGNEPSKEAIDVGLADIKEK